MELENYKKSWSNQIVDTNSVSKTDIYKMAHSHSSSIVKWIFIISILEFIFMNSLYFFIDTKKTDALIESLGMTKLILIIQIVTYLILFYFLWQFYKNYKTISVMDDMFESC